MADDDAAEGFFVFASVFGFAAASDPSDPSASFVFGARHPPSTAFPRLGARLFLLPGAPGEPSDSFAADSFASRVASSDPAPASDPTSNDRSNANQVS